MKYKLMKQGDRYVLYAEGGHKVACTSDSPYKKLSLKNCQAIERGYDLDELAKNACPDTISSANSAYKAGFQKALEILGDRRFTEEDVIRAMQDYSLLDISEDKIIQSLQQNEWEVEIVTTTRMENGKSGLDAPVEKPKLDENGCLVLRKIS